MSYTAPKIKWRKQKEYRSDVIATAKASGCVLQFWNSLIVGDALTILSIVDDDEYEHLVDVTFDTSNIEEWRNFRFNYRCLSRFFRVFRICMNICFLQAFLKSDQGRPFTIKQRV